MSLCCVKKVIVSGCGAIFGLCNTSHQLVEIALVCANAHSANFSGLGLEKWKRLIWNNILQSDFCHQQFGVSHELPAL